MPSVGWVEIALPAIASVCCWLFAAMLLGQWWSRRRPYQLIWALGLVFYALAAGADAVGNAWGWNEATYRIWYFFGAVCVAAWLGLGEVYLFRTGAFGELVALGVFAGAIPALIRGGRLLGAHDDAQAQAVIAIGVAGIAAAGVLALVGWERPEWLGTVALSLVVVGTLYGAWQVATAPVDVGRMLDPRTGIPHGEALPDTVRLLTPLFNIGGALALLFGAVYSAWTYWRRGAPAERVASASLIALGAFAPSLTSTLNRFGITEVFYWGELLGVLLILAGFLVSTEVIARRRHGHTAERAGAPAPRSAAG